MSLDSFFFLKSVSFSAVIAEKFFQGLIEICHIFAIPGISSNWFCSGEDTGDKG